MVFIKILKNTNQTRNAFIRFRNLNISLVFITQSYFALPRNNKRNNSTQYFIMKNPNKREPQQIEFNHTSDTDFKDFKFMLLLHLIIVYVSERIF